MRSDQSGVANRRLFVGIAGFAAAVLILWLTPLLAQVPEAGCGKNLSFEESSGGGGPACWSADSKFFSLERGAGRDGTAALRLNADGQTHTTASQVLEVVSGTTLDYSAYIRTEDVENGTAKVAIEWTGRGKWLGGSYSHPLGDDQEDGWQKVGGTAHIPVEADRVTFICYITRGGKGTAWYDDCRVQEVVTSVYSAITSDHYRHLTDGKDFDGKLTIRVGVALSGAVVSPRDAAAPLVIRESEDTAELMTLQPSEFGDDYIDYVVPAEELPPGTYTAEVSSPPGLEGIQQSIRLTFTRVEEYPERHAYIDRYCRLIVDGQPFFPLGCYFGSANEREQEIYADSAFNCLMPYGSISREDLDRCQKNNIKVIYSVKNNYGTPGEPSEQEAIERTCKTVEDLKDHPAIIAWYTNDESPLSMIKQLTDRRDLMERLDPDRPTWVVLNQIDEVRSYIPSFDAVGTDLYPIPYEPPRAVAKATEKTKRGVWGKYALWQVPQIYNRASYADTEEKKKALRPPTLEEMRGMFWMEIAAGANGLIAYSWFDLWRMDKTIAEGGRAVVRDPFWDRWGEVKTVAAEIAQFFPVLLAVDPAIDARVSDEQGADDTVVRLYGHEGKTWMLIVNLLDETQTVPFEASEAESAELQLGGKLVSFEEGKGSVELEAFQPCFVVLTPKK
ncbi:MAG: hypothetical protein IJH68_00785 [Thermoguttaceae bacterium]|nr:hypothetical protein [Thermoguttaceae bacterium]MBQ6618664.1 hypothetical protein [Thermoguttaceae bacterium]